MSERQEQIERMRTCRLLCPLHNKEHPATAQDIDDLVAAFKFMGADGHPDFRNIGAQMKSELKRYNMLCQFVQKPPTPAAGTGSVKFPVLTWWRQKKLTLPAFTLVLRGVVTHAPSSAMCERVFSILNNSFDKQQLRALADYMELSLMLQFNRKESEGSCVQN